MKKIFQIIEISFENFIYLLIGSSYKNEWENQNILIDEMTVNTNKMQEKYENIINKKNARINELEIRLNIQRDKLSKNEEIHQRFKVISEIKYLEMQKKYNDIIYEKKKLSCSKGGLNSRIRYQKEKIKKYEEENKELKKLLQKVIQESKRKITPPTYNELQNYKLFRRRKGIKK